jgi:hypothetical protein
VLQILCNGADIPKYWLWDMCNSRLILNLRVLCTSTFYTPDMVMGWTALHVKIVVNLGEYAAYVITQVLAVSSGMTGLRTGRQGTGLRFLPTVSRLALRPADAPVLWVPTNLSPETKRSGLEAKHSPPSLSSEVKNALSYTSTPHTKVYPKVSGLNL